ncbi:MAG TPA: hypothetical protein DDY37_05670, partial [Legionella sp.]|nr:hypothetical protein [Legionella sp.]
LISPLGSASRPIWICVNQSFVHEEHNGYCDNVPTIQAFNSTTLNTMSLSLNWKGKGYFNEGIWRFQINTTGAYTLEIDHKLPCCAQSLDDCCCERTDTIQAASHVYLKGMHTVDLTLYDQQMADPFTLLVYRIR